MDIIVIGAGIAGCATAWYLVQEGANVLILERDEPNLQASGANAGSLHGQIQYEPFRNQGAAWTEAYLPALPFYAWSIKLWHEAQISLPVDLEVLNTGGLIVAATFDELRRIEEKTSCEQRAGIATEMLDREELLKRAPYLSRELHGGAFCPIEGKANPLLAVPAIANAAIALGATMRTRCEVTGIERGDDGTFKVETAGGEVFKAPRVVNAAGVGAARIAAMVGRKLPLKAYPIQLSVTEAVTPLIRHLVYSAETLLTLKQAKNGTILIGGGWPADIDAQGRPQISPNSLSRNLAVALKVVPALADIQIVRCWAAVVNGTDDWLPVLGELPECPGFFINYVPWMGFTGGPAGARIVASLVLNQQPPVDFDITPFSL